jgi:hypothetical protein
LLRFNSSYGYSVLIIVFAQNVYFPNGQNYIQICQISI